MTASLLSLAVVAAGMIVGVWRWSAAQPGMDARHTQPAVGGAISHGLRSAADQEDRDASNAAEAREAEAKQAGKKDAEKSARSAKTFKEKVAAVRETGLQSSGTHDGSTAGQASAAVPPSLATAVERVRHAVVTVITDSDDIGSGFILQRRRWLVTNHHVVAGCSEAAALRRRDEGAGWIEIAIEGFVACDPGADLVLLALGQDWPAEPLTLATDKPMLGEDVFAIGTPEGLPETVTRGIVSQIRSAADLQSNLAATTPIIQTDAFFTFGSSGGPLCAANGKVIGINTFGHTTDSGNVFRFAVSAKALGPLIEKASGMMRPLHELPPARDH
jgi:S1-C subfamily serine protease